ncbi:MAG TPA: hypothetical protein VFG66_04385 [Gemmatimonadales bacterium]|nr:hypothetical protein [Gemmatimonadales bacterium]
MSAKIRSGGALSGRHRPVLAAALLLAACSRPNPPAEPAHAVRSDSTPAFANRVWKVARSSAGDPGTFYVFLSDGSLLITSPHGTPSLGSWRFAGDTLTLVEEGIAHPAAVLRLGADTLAIRIPGPGEPVEITFVPAVTR